MFIFPRYRVAPLYPQALVSLLVASNNSQGYGGGIQTHLHTHTHTHTKDFKSKSKSKSCYDRRFSWPVCLGIKRLSGAYDQIFITVRQLQACSSGALSLTRGRVCRLPDSVSSNMSLVSMYNLHVTSY
jgi:hypothetical protein